jgi:hypothetical protein
MTELAMIQRLLSAIGKLLGHAHGRPEFAQQQTKPDAQRVSSPPDWPMSGSVYARNSWQLLTGGDRSLLVEGNHALI